MVGSGRLVNKTIGRVFTAGTGANTLLCPLGCRHTISRMRGVGAQDQRADGGLAMWVEQLDDLIHEFG